jgi:hypothetical protein
MSLHILRLTEEGVDNFSLAGEIDVWNRCRTLHPATCPAREMDGRRAVAGAFPQAARMSR